MSIHPKLAEAESSQYLTSLTIAGEDVQVYLPIPATTRVSLGVGEKSPPCLDHNWVLKNRCFHVASPVVAAPPLPSSPAATEVPSPQSARTRCRSTRCPKEEVRVK